MPSFNNLFRWHVWSPLWSILGNFVKRLNFLQYQFGQRAQASLDTENARLSREISPCVVESHPIEQPEDTEKTLHVKQPPNCIWVGFSGVICEADENTIVKHPKVIPGNDLYNRMFCDMIINERLIYERLGNHRGIITYLGIHDQSTGAIRLAYAKQGTLERYIQTHEEPPVALRATWIQSLVDTFWHIYSRKVLHQDVKPNNILVENGSLKVVDFANASMHGLDADMEEICMEDPLSRVDILGLGCIIYSIAAWQIFYYDYFKHDRWPELEDLPTTSDLHCAEIINKCWNGSYGNIKSLYKDFVAISDLRKEEHNSTAM